jgi:acetyl esterase/lipase
MPRVLAVCGSLVLLACMAAGNARAQQPRLRMPEGTRVLRDLAYVADGHERQNLDLYVPPDIERPPLVVWIHGGAWRAGSKERPRGFRPLLEAGIAVASLNYRLSQHAQFPAQLEDCKAAIRWLRAHSDEHGYDPDRIGVWGASAGGHLAALVGTTAATEKFDVGLHRDVSSAVQAVCVWFGPTDFSKMDEQAAGRGPFRHNAANSPESLLIGGPVPEHPDRVQAANPVTYVTPQAPPFLIMHGDADVVVPVGQGRLLFEALQAAGVEVTFDVIEGAGHGFGGQSGELEPRVVEFFRKHL